MQLSCSRFIFLLHTFAFCLSFLLYLFSLFSMFYQRFILYFSLMFLCLTLTLIFNPAFYFSWMSNVSVILFFILSTLVCFLWFFQYFSVLLINNWIASQVICSAIITFLCYIRLPHCLQSYFFLNYILVQFISHSLLWRHIVLLTVGVYSSNHRVLYTIEISMTRRFQKSVGPSVRLSVCSSVRPSVCNANKKSLLLLHY